ncbi:hypothetical protein SCB71_14300 [Herbiconiux sp. KACC 21604]|uniref:hypothetical protein n=1 Tax=unclassified Herbiconiux TaxID=2618217 RepID=UPI001490953C|nr:hypothetical protein [Herbiconiux sp. SALV-R1]QJU54313.1 hypothetical protein HL652_12240 [Herbiconiux sp. SALV-R1]WPO85383.1 hypothetical protein SCB71_14300 [Herbiconiux sp. KACC 21604]
MLFLARGIEDDNYMVVEQVDGMLVDAAWRIDKEWDGWAVSHADSNDVTAAAGLRGYGTPEAAVDALRALLSRP